MVYNRAMVIASRGSQEATKKGLGKLASRAMRMRRLQTDGITMGPVKDLYRKRKGMKELPLSLYRMQSCNSSVIM